MPGYTWKKEGKHGERQGAPSTRRIPKQKNEFKMKLLGKIGELWVGQDKTISYIYGPTLVKGEGHKDGGKEIMFWCTLPPQPSSLKVNKIK